MTKDWLNIKPCPNLFHFRLWDKRKQCLTQILKTVMCDRVKGHPGKCRVQNPNDGLFYETEAEFDESAILPESYFRQQ